MKRIFRLFSILYLAFPAFGQAPRDIINRAVNEVAAQPANFQKPPKAAAAELETMDGKVVTNALYDAFQKPEALPDQRPTIARIVSNISNFDIDIWATRLENETDPMILCYGLILSDDKGAESQDLKTLMIKLLSDQRVGQGVYGEARGYISEGLRVCDIALNMLWSRQPESTWPPGIPVDAIVSKRDRDNLIADYAAKFGMTMTAGAALNTRSDMSTRTVKEAPATAADQC